MPIVKHLLRLVLYLRSREDSLPLAIVVVCLRKRPRNVIKLTVSSLARPEAIASIIVLLL